jgi:hypothetical protein
MILDKFILCEEKRLFKYVIMLLIFKIENLTKINSNNLEQFKSKYVF